MENSVQRRGLKIVGKVESIQQVAFHNQLKSCESCASAVCKVNSKEIKLPVPGTPEAASAAAGRSLVTVGIGAGWKEKVWLSISHC